MRTAVRFCIVTTMLTAVLSAQANEYYDKYYNDPNVIAVDRDGEIVDRVPCERILLDFPGLQGRGEAHMALDSKGNIR